MQLTDEQDHALNEITRWYEQNREGWSGAPFRLFGYAGTGKTTLAQHVAPMLGIQAVSGAYTGKAAKVLRTKGLDATTIHSALYRPISSADTLRRLVEARQDLESMQKDTLEDPVVAGWASGMELAGAIDEQRELIKSLEHESRTVGFQLNQDSGWARADLIILDEVSMVNTKIGQDIDSLDVPVLVLGDPAQLPPVDGGGYYTDADPDVMLTQVQRQAAESPVLQLATRIRTASGRDFGLTPDDVANVSLDAAMAADQVLVWRNATRWNLTNAIRSALGRPAGHPVPGDRVMCLTNNREMGVLNGTQYLVQEVDPTPDQPGPRLLLEEIDSGMPPRWMKTYYEGFQNQAAEGQMKRMYGTHRGDRGAFTFANVITVHKAQGSEWNNVYVVDQIAGVISMARKEMSPHAAVEMGRRWLYTAVTRASDHVTIARK